MQKRQVAQDRDGNYRQLCDKIASFLLPRAIASPGPTPRGVVVRG